MVAAGPDAKEVIDKAIVALGGEAKITALEGKTVETKSKGKLNFGGNEGDFTTTTTTIGLNKFRQEFKADFGGNEVKGVTVLDGDKAGANRRQFEQARGRPARQPEAGDLSFGRSGDPPPVEGQGFQGRIG